MSVTYRCAYNDKFEVVCIGYDENQSGKYLDEYTWCDFTFNEIPEIPSDVQELLGNGHEPLRILLLKVDVQNQRIYVKSKEEIMQELEESAQQQTQAD